MSETGEWTPERLRERILEVVSKNGGHLASSLGAVEIALALAKTFDPERDRVVWDVGHQAYAWKILTGRDDRFDTLRKLGGISGFPNPHESNCDAAVAGHAGVSLSVAAGLAAARDRRGGGENVIAVVGDGAIVNGTSFEAFNNLAAATKKLIVVLNDNEMSISRPIGSVSKVLGRLIIDIRYNRVKSAAEKAGHALKLTFLRGIYHRIESRIKSLFLGNTFFEQFGIRYIGPVDGHDLNALLAAFTVAKEDKRSVVVHVVTKKGKGYEPAEKDPTAWHGVGPFAYGESEKIEERSEKREDAKSWSDVFGEALCEEARRDDRIIALTAGMKDGTGLVDFAREFPRRFYDVGIAEGHMTAFAAGLAAGGMRPVVAIYSTFLQRAVDQVMHDVCLANLPVVFCVDRAGVVGADGATHQGLYDIAMLRCLPNLTICQPKDAEDFKSLLAGALCRNGPTVIRYPRGKVAMPQAVRAARGPYRDSISNQQPATNNQQPATNNEQRTTNNQRPTTALWATGDWYAKARAAAERIPGCVAVHARYLKPFDSLTLADQRRAGMKIVSLENGCVSGGFGEAIGADLKLGWPDEFIPHGSQSELDEKYGLSVEAIVRRIQDFLGKK